MKTQSQELNLLYAYNEPGAGMTYTSAVWGVSVTFKDYNGDITHSLASYQLWLDGGLLAFPRKADETFGYPHTVHSWMI